MIHSRIDSYSVFNSYQYENKSGLKAQIDWLSAPFRKVFGGRNISVLSNTQEDKPSVVKRAKIAVSSALFFPIAIISLFSFGLNLLTLPWKWERKKVKEQSEKTWKVMNEFNKAVLMGKENEAVQHLSSRPEIVQREDITQKLFKIINNKINCHSSWEEIEGLLSHLNEADAITLVNCAVGLRISEEFKNDRILTRGYQIIQFVERSMKNNRESGIIACYERIIAGALRINDNEDPILTAIRIDQADFLIRELSRRNFLAGMNSDSIKANELLMRSKFIMSSNRDTQHFGIFNSTENMSKLHIAIEEIRNVNRMGWDSVEKVNALTEHPEEHWQIIRDELVKFQDCLKTLARSVSETERKQIEARVKSFQSMILFVESVARTDDPKEITRLGNQLIEELRREGETLPELVKIISTTISEDKPYFKNLLTALRLKKLTNLFLVSEKMKQLLTKKIAAKTNSMASC